MKDNKLREQVEGLLTAYAMLNRFGGVGEAAQTNNDTTDQLLSLIQSEVDKRVKEAIKEEVQKELDIAWSAYKQGISWYPIGGEIKFLKARGKNEYLD